MKYRLLFLLSLASVGLRGQDYLVTTRKDTLRGEIAIQSFEKLDRILLTADKKKTVYPAYSVLRVFVDSATYQPVRTVEAFRFMKISRSGLVSLCYAQQGPATPYNVPYLVKLSGESLEVNALRFKKTMARFLDECESINTKIEEESLGRNDLEKIVDTYNSCLEKQTTVAFSPSEDPKLIALNAFNQKLSLDSAVPADAREILKDLYTKVKEKKAVPNYLADGLRETLKDFPVYHQDLEALLAVLKNQ